MAERKFTLTTTEVAELKAAYHQSKDANYSKKLLAVRLYGTGHSTKSILDLIGCGRTSLMEWVQRYQLDGVDGLNDRRQGGNHYKLTKAEKAAIERDIHQYSPRQLLGKQCATHSGAHWTAADLKLLIYQKYEVIYKSPASYWALLTECGLSYQRTEKIFKSKSALKQADFEEQLEKK
jgi:putative transposase